jgi:hypothetical protein
MRTELVTATVAAGMLLLAPMASSAPGDARLTVSPHEVQPGGTVRASVQCRSYTNPWLYSVGS